MEKRKENKGYKCCRTVKAWKCLSSKAEKHLFAPSFLEILSFPFILAPNQFSHPPTLLASGKEGNIDLEAKEALLQCISAYKEFVYEKTVPDAPHIKNEYLSCLMHAQNLLGNKLDEEPRS